MNAFENSATESMKRTEYILQSLINSLSHLEEKKRVETAVSEKNLMILSDETDNDLADFKNSLQKLKETRQNIYRYTFAQIKDVCLRIKEDIFNEESRKIWQCQADCVRSES